MAGKGGVDAATGPGREASARPSPVHLTRIATRKTRAPESAGFQETGGFRPNPSGQCTLGTATRAGPALRHFRGYRICACAAARRAIGTRNGEQLT